ncbi:MAG: amidohydrolase family protein [Candidatus Abyssubacteria bacterium]|nr:amidohydrolase family protein [Candidatus Abyssubacteria bacterium]
MELDLVIERGWIVDGVSPSIYRGTIGISGDKIEYVRPGFSRLPGKRVIDASEYCVAPGFIDIHSHADHFLLLDPAMKNKLMQGVTTEIGGNCGSSAYPWNESNIFYLPGMEEEFSWTSFGGFLQALEAGGISINFGSQVGLCSLHGETNGALPANGGMKQMKRILADSLQEGALGLSAGIGSRPETRLSLSQMAELCGLVANEGRVLSVHLNGEGAEILDSLSEAISVSAKSGVSLQISHFKTLDRLNWPKQQDALELIEKMRAMGIDINIDCFPYTTCCSPLRVFTPPHMISGGAKFKALTQNDDARAEINKYLEMHFPTSESYRAVVVPYLETPDYRDLQGLDLYTASGLAGSEPGSLVLDLVIAEGPDRFVYYDCISESNARAAIGLDCAMVSSDSFPTGIPKYFKNSIIHPRTFGAFPEFLCEYVYGNHILTLPEAIKKITSIPAQKFGLRGRGVIGEGAFADITIFDPENIHSGATIADPCNPPSGIEYVIVNGQVALEGGRFNEVFAGKVLRGGE